MSDTTCPDCAEDVRSEARVCPHCGYKFLSSGERATKAFEVAFVVICVGVALAWFTLRGR